MPDIGDQASEKNIALIIKGGKLTAETLAKAVKKLIESGTRPTPPKDMNGRGRQSVRQLARQGQGVSNIEINDKNIRSFEGVARKYGVDYAVKKDRAESPPKWLVFFKGRDADALTAAFREFTAREAERQRRREKPSVTKTLDRNAEKAKTQIVAKERKKTRGGREL